MSGVHSGESTLALTNESHCKCGVAVSEAVSLGLTSCNLAHMVSVVKGATRADREVRQNKSVLTCWLTVRI